MYTHKHTPHTSHTQTHTTHHTQKHTHSVLCALSRQDFGAHGVEPFEASTSRAFDILHIVKMYIQQQPILEEVIH